MKTDHVIAYNDREKPQTCPKCNGIAEYDFVMGKAPFGKVAGPTGGIFDEREITSERGEKWRDEGTTGNPGGAGAKLYFH